MSFKTQAGHWRFAAARFPDAVHFHLDPLYVPNDAYTWIYTLEAIAVDMIDATQKAGTHAAILVHGNPTLAPGMISLRTIVRGIMRDECAAPYLRPADCIECEAAFIAVLRPLPARRMHTK